MYNIFFYGNTCNKSMALKRTNSDVLLLVYFQLVNIECQTFSK